MRHRADIRREMGLGFRGYRHRVRFTVLRLGRVLVLATGLVTGTNAPTPAKPLMSLRRCVVGLVEGWLIWAGQWWWHAPTSLRRGGDMGARVR